LKSEIFGPVAPIVITSSDEEAIELANATEFGLISYVYSADLKRAIKVAESLECGMVAINKGVISDPAAPFGGVKQSGLGREGGFAGIEEFLETKYIGIEI
jgi:succinate-semialdehyde dehydrogenase/glutarate-semialdehyde dehydrogenase